MFDYILSLGGTVFVPIIMIVIGLIFRIPWLQAIKAGVTVGIGFVGLLLIPIMLILASILPGNKVLPLADLPVAPFFICMATVIHRGDLIRTLISGVIVMITVLLIATQFAPYFTEMALKGGFSFAGESAQISALSVGNMFGWSISELMSLGIIGVVVAVGIVASVVLFLRKRELSE